MENPCDCQCGRPALHNLSHPKLFEGWWNICTECFRDWYTLEAWWKLEGDPAHVKR